MGRDLGNSIDVEGSVSRSRAFSRDLQVIFFLVWVGLFLGSVL